MTRPSKSIASLLAPAQFGCSSWYFALFGVQTIGAVILLWNSVPLYRQVLADPTFEARGEHLPWGILSIALMQLGYWVSDRIRLALPRLSSDDILDNIAFYWLTNAGVSSARLYWENKLAFFAPKNVQIPVAVSVYPDEIYATPRGWAEKAFPKLIYFNKLPKGGHFAAWGQLAFFVSDVRAAFKSLRT
jgi:hypothetical protein